MSQPRQQPPPVPIPKIEKCPRCGQPILLGDLVCSNCGYRVNIPLEQRLKRQPPNVVAIVGIVVGLFLGLGAITTSGVLQAVLVLAALACFLAGGLFYAAHLLYLGDPRRRKPPKME
ncbi:MAG: hypothetical protein HC915_07665 [Anaerolineae bacterium]|nr:hypothetical protein [Anaerolineae bacterium]